jgi:hypothetical protein
MLGTGPWPQQVNLQLCTSQHDQARGRTKITYSYAALKGALQTFCSHAHEDPTSLVAVVNELVTIFGLTRFHLG